MNKIVGTRRAVSENTEILRTKRAHTRCARTRHAVSLLLLAALFFTAAEFQNLPPLIVAVSSTGGTTSVAALDDLDGLLLTYEHRQTATVTALNSRFDAVLVGTNSSYGFVMGFPVISGGFFERAAVEHAHNVAVLNESAAFEMFGTHSAAGNVLEIRGAVYRVIGVVADSIEETQIYLPVTRLTNAVDNAAVVVGDATLGVPGMSISLGTPRARQEFTGLLSPTKSVPEILALLGQANITHSSHSFVNIAELAQAAMARFVLAAQIFAGLILLAAAKQTGGLFLKNFRILKKSTAEKYLPQIIRSKESFKMLSAAVLVMTLTAGLLLLAQNALYRALAIGVTVGTLVPFSGYGDLYSTALFWNMAGWILFWCCSILQGGVYLFQSVKGAKP